MEAMRRKTLLALGPPAENLDIFLFLLVFLVLVMRNIMARERLMENNAGGGASDIAYRFLLYWPFAE